MRSFIMYTSPCIFMTIKLGRISFTGHAGRMMEVVVRAQFWLESLKERDHSKDLGVGRILFKWFFRK
jgi:hypothetical protein